MTVAPRIGLFGLGNMGDAVASRLRTLAPVIAYDPDPGRAAKAAVAHDIEIASTPADVVTDAVVLSLPSPRVSHEVVDTLCETLAPGSLVIETSTVNPEDARTLHQRCDAAGLRFIDAAILSGVAQMYDGRSSLLVGGDDADVAHAAPILDALAPSRRHLGPVGSGMAAKVINNAVAHAVMVVLTEAGALAAANGVDGHALAELLAGPDAGLTRPLTHRYAERILNGDFEGGMPTEAARKDSVLALVLAQSGGVPLFAMQASHTVYEMAVGHDLGRLDYSAIARLWEQWTGRSLQAGAARTSPMPASTADPE